MRTSPTGSCASSTRGAIAGSRGWSGTVEAPLYHLDLVLLSAEERAAKVARYAVARPGLRAPGGGELNARYYLPERHARLEPVPVPPEDRERVAALAGAGREFEHRPLRG